MCIVLFHLSHIANVNVERASGIFKRQIYYKYIVFTLGKLAKIKETSRIRKKK